MIAERFAGHSGVKYLRSLGCERVQFKNQVCNPELRGLPAKSVAFCKAKHARILLQHDRGQPSQSTAAAAGDQPVEQQRTRTRKGLSPLRHLKFDATCRVEHEQSILRPPPSFAGRSGPRPVAQVREPNVPRFVTLKFGWSGVRQIGVVDPLPTVLNASAQSLLDQSSPVRDRTQFPSRRLRCRSRE